MIQTIIQRADDFKRSNPKEFLKLNKLLKLANIKKEEADNSDCEVKGKDKELLDEIVQVFPAKI